VSQIYETPRHPSKPQTKDTGFEADIYMRNNGTHTPASPNPKKLPSHQKISVYIEDEIGENVYLRYVN
jgi:hypothetical protein